MRDAIVSYFAGEKHAALALVAASVVAFLAAFVLFSARWGLRSLAVTVGAFAAVLLAIGVGLYLRTGPQVEQLLAEFGSDASRFFDGEIARMGKVQRNFLIVEYVELTLIVASAVIAIAFKSRSALVGVALGCLLNAAFLLAFDLVAERRGAAYLAELEKRTTDQSR